MEVRVLPGLQKEGPRLSLLKTGSGLARAVVWKSVKCCMRLTGTEETGLTGTQSSGPAHGANCQRSLRLLLAPRATETMHHTSLDVILLQWPFKPNWPSAWVTLKIQSPGRMCPLDHPSGLVHDAELLGAQAICPNQLLQREILSRLGIPPVDIS